MSTKKVTTTTVNPGNRRGFQNYNNSGKPWKFARIVRVKQNFFIFHCSSCFFILSFLIFSFFHFLFFLICCFFLFIFLHFFIFAGRHTTWTVKRPPPYTCDSNHLYSHAHRARKSWRSPSSCLGPGQYPQYTVPTSVGRLWVAQFIRAQTALSWQRGLKSEGHGREAQDTIHGRNPHHADATRQLDDVDL